MNRNQLLEILSQVDPRIADELLSGQLPMDEFLRQYMPDGNELLGFDKTRIRISDNNYFDNDTTEIIEDQGKIGSIRTSNVWDCGHTGRTYQLGGIDSFGHTICIQCFRWCDIGRHPCCVMDSKILLSGLIACDCHTGIWRFSNWKFNKWRKR